METVRQVAFAETTRGLVTPGHLVIVAQRRRASMTRFFIDLRSKRK
jgi:hypothetical protein